MSSPAGGAGAKGAGAKGAAGKKPDVLKAGDINWMTPVRVSDPKSGKYAQHGTVDQIVLDPTDTVGVTFVVRFGKDKILHTFTRNQFQIDWDRMTKKERARRMAVLETSEEKRRKRKRESECDDDLSLWSSD